VDGRAAPEDQERGVVDKAPKIQDDRGQVIEAF
jgi:hypothetical protein